MSATIEDWVSLLDEQLVELTNGDDQAVGFLALAWESLNTDRARQLAISAWVRDRLTGTEGQRLGAWYEVVEAVDLWSRWNDVADSQGRHSELNLPSRERVCTGVELALRDLIARVA